MTGDAPQARTAAAFTAEQLLLTTTQAAQVLRVGRTTVYALINDGALRPVHIGRSCRITRAELQRYVERLDGQSGSPATDPSDLSPARRKRRPRTSADQRALFGWEAPPTDAA